MDANMFIPSEVFPAAAPNAAHNTTLRLLTPGTTTPSAFLYSPMSRRTVISSGAPVDASRAAAAHSAIATGSVQPVATDTALRICAKQVSSKTPIRLQVSI